MAAALIVMAFITVASVSSNDSSPTPRQPTSIPVEHDSTVLVGDEIVIGECKAYPCLHGGVCTVQAQSIGGQAKLAHKCRCEKGWHGTDCANEDLDCTSQPCQNGGQCSEPTSSDMCSDKVPAALQSKLALDLRGHAYTKGSYKLTNRVVGGPDAVLDAVVDKEYDLVSGTFHFGQGNVITAQLATNPKAMPAVTYEAWVKVGKYDKTKGWIVSQYPDYGWSRAITLSDSRMGVGPAITPGGFDYGTKRQPVDTWFHVLGAFEEGKSSTIYVDGVPGRSRKGHNGMSKTAGQLASEKLIIGGRGPGDGAHNMRYVSVASVRVYSARLTDTDAMALKAGECAQPLGIYKCKCINGWTGHNCDIQH